MRTGDVVDILLGDFARDAHLGPVRSQRPAQVMERPGSDPVPGFSELLVEPNFRLGPPIEDCRGPVRIAVLGCWEDVQVFLDPRDTFQDRDRHVFNWKAVLAAILGGGRGQGDKFFAEVDPRPLKRRDLVPTLASENEKTNNRVEGRLAASC